MTNLYSYPSEQGEELSKLVTPCSRVATFAPCSGKHWNENILIGCADGWCVTASPCPHCPSARPVGLCNGTKMLLVDRILPFTILSTGHVLKMVLFPFFSGLSKHSMATNMSAELPARLRLDLRCDLSGSGSCVCFTLICFAQTDHRQSRYFSR